MSPILGIWASAQQSAAATSFDSIATTTVGAGGSSTITFSSIPSTYTHLQLRAYFTTASGGTGLSATFNSDSGANYGTHFLIGQGTSASASNYLSQNAAYLMGFSAGSSTTDPAPVITDILDYTNTNKNTTVRTLSGVDKNGSGEVALVSNLWLNTAAITSITLFNGGSIKYNQYSSFALYGIK